MSDHPLDPFECKAGGNCELHEMARVTGLEHVRYNHGGKNHLDLEVDDSNPYFAFDPTRCILCSRCVRACDDTQGTFALTIEGRGFNSLMSPGQHQHYIDSECVSCGACVQACPTDALMEKTVLEKGRADRAIVTTCGYCGVGCSFKAEVSGDEIVRMVPNKDGFPNHGHSCVKGRFAWGYATHPDRAKKPMIRKRIVDPWQEVSWEEAIAYAAAELKRVQNRYGRGSIGGITSSRCTNEEAYLVQKMVRAAFGNNNVDTCARVCHSPTGYGLKTAFGTPGGDARLRFGRKQRRHHGDRRESDRRSSGVRLDHEAAAARGRAPDRRRPAPDRAGADAARQGGLFSPAHARHQRCPLQRYRPRDRDRGAGRRRVHRGALRFQGIPALARLYRRTAQFARGHGASDRRAGGRYSRRRAALREGTELRDLLRPRSHRA